MEEKASMDTNKVNVREFKEKKKRIMEQTYMWLIYGLKIKIN